MISIKFTNRRCTRITDVITCRTVSCRSSNMFQENLSYPDLGILGKDGLNKPKKPHRSNLDQQVPKYWFGK